MPCGRGKSSGAYCCILCWERGTRVDHCSSEAQSQMVPLQESHVSHPTSTTSPNLMPSRGNTIEQLGHVFTFLSRLRHKTNDFQRSLTFPAHPYVCWCILFIAQLSEIDQTEIVCSHLSLDAFVCTMLKDVGLTCANHNFRQTLVLGQRCEHLITATN